MKIIAVSDLHGHLPEIEPCDLLIVAGDIVMGFLDMNENENWLAHNFNDWLKVQPARHIVGIAGNHDWPFVSLNPPKLDWIYLKDSATEIDGIKIWGSPWQPWFGDWAFNAPPGPQGEEFLAEKYSLIPEDTNIIISHGPPLNHGDKNSWSNACGSKALLEAIGRIKPAYVVCGHIHEGYGCYKLNETTIVNASQAGRNMSINPPQVFEI